MRSIFLIVCALLFWCFPTGAWAQHYDTDSSTFYTRLFERANKHALTRWLYEITFEKEAPGQPDSVVSIIKSKKKNPFLKYKGKVIRSINIVVLDPFGYSVNDFYAKKPDYLERLGNKYHVTTNNAVINNLLLFEKGSALSPLALSESERLLRLSPSIYDARLYVTDGDRKSKDSVDVMVVVQDKWSTVAWSTLDLSAPDIRFAENNFLGIGHQLEEDIIWRTSDKYVETKGHYGIYNIRNSFIQMAAYYSTVKEKQLQGFSLTRPFYSPLAKWAGGLSIAHNYSVVPLAATESNIVSQYGLSFTQFECWGAKSFPIIRHSNKGSDQHSTNFIIGAGYFRTDYSMRPAMILDAMHNYQSEVLYIANVGLSKRRYYRDKYLFRFGANEDIPEGRSMEFLLGFLKREGDQMIPYTGMKFGTGRHIDDIGYFSLNMSAGFLTNGNTISSGVINFGTFYFSDLFKVNRWHFRQFVRFNVIEGLNRLPFEQLNINGTQMYGFQSATLMGNSKVVLNLEFLMYTPYKFLGFQFVPVLYLGLAGLGQNPVACLSGRIFQSYAIGLLVRNEYLISSTFQLSIGFYPFTPGNSDYLIKTNPISSFEVRARDYFISKPSRVEYQ